MTLPQKASTPLSGHSDAPRAHSGALRDLQASDWEVLLSGLMAITFLGPRNLEWGGRPLPEFQLMLPRCEALPVKLLLLLLSRVSHVLLCVTP